jgi:hypothetical protein
MQRESQIAAIIANRTGCNRQRAACTTDKMQQTECNSNAKQSAKMKKKGDTTKHAACNTGKMQGATQIRCSMPRCNMQQGKHDMPH